MKNILVTGGAGYIGSHTVVALCAAGYTVTIVDNLSNSNEDIVRRLETITKTSIDSRVMDLRDVEQLEMLFAEKSFAAVLHFAALKAVGESTERPLLYYRTNIDSTLTLLETMQKYEVFNLVFSSSATVYGAAPVPYSEDGPIGLGITNPYGKTKYTVECILQDLATSDERWKIGALRYFNPIGAHPSGLIGENPKGIPNNTMPYITQVASRERDILSIFGNDYDTPDGTCVRDYIHVDDVAEGHLAMMDKLDTGFTAVNLGSGRGTSVLELVHTFEEASGIAIPYTIKSRRPGDLPSFYAQVDRAHNLLDWHATRTLEQMCRDSWNWQKSTA